MRCDFSFVLSFKARKNFVPSTNSHISTHMFHNRLVVAGVVADPVIISRKSLRTPFR
jgi:hypothetical protein